MTQVPGALTRTADSCILPANCDASRGAAGPVGRLEENPQTEYAGPTSTTEADSMGSASIVNTACEYPVAGMIGIHSLVHSLLYLAESFNPSAAPSACRAPVRPPRSSVDQAPSNLATEAQDNSRPLDPLIGSTLSPDDKVQEGAKHTGQKVPDSSVVPTVPIIATPGQHEHSVNPSPQPIHLVSSNATAQPNHVHQDFERSSRASRTSSIQQKAQGLTAIVPIKASREKDASEPSFTTQVPSSAPSKRTSSSDRIKSNAGSGPHSAYTRLPPSKGEGLDELSTRAVGGDTSVTSPSISVENGDSVNSTSRKAAAGIQHAPRPIFSEEHDRALGTRRERETALAAGAITGGATAAVVAAKEGDKTEGKRFQHSTSLGNTKSSRFSGTRKLTKGATHSLSGGGRASTDLPAGAAFPESTYVIFDDVGAPQDLTKDPLLVPLPVSKGDSSIIEPTPTPAFAAGSPEHKQHKLIKKPPSTVDAPPRVSDPLIRSSPESVGTSTGLRADTGTMDAHVHKAPEGAPETGRLVPVNGGATKPKLMDRIKGEVKIMQGTLKGDEGKKMEGRRLKEFGSF
jgi:hypothetical protein